MNDQLTRMLLWACQRIEELAEGCICHYGRGRGELPPELERWWEEHKLLDAQRRERVRRDALAKLTDEEKEALGLEKWGEA